jgi:hypothetical protein
MKKIVVTLTFLSLFGFISWSFFGTPVDIDSEVEVRRSVASLSEEESDISPKFKKKLQAISHIATCFESRSCGFSKEDSRSYDLELGNSLKREIYKLYEDVADQEIEAQWVSDVARKYMNVSNGHVKEAALMLMSTQPPSSENLDSILDDVISFHSAPLAELAMVELSKYQKESWKSQIDKSFLDNLSRGSLLVRQTLAKNISTFLNDGNREIYESFIESLSGNSKVKKFISASLRN